MRHLKRIIRVELTAIYLATALLTISVAGFLVKTAGSSAGYRELYPHLRVLEKAPLAIPEQKTVYLTFDDGPSHNTEKVLDVLAEQGVPATFFVTTQMESEEDRMLLLRRIMDEGHSIGLHSFLHESKKIYRSADHCMEDLNQLNDYLYEALGIRPEFLRFAGGSATVMAKPGVMREIITEVERRGYRFYDWDIVSGDDKSYTVPAEDLVENILNGVRKNEDQQQLIVLMHDNPAATTTPMAVGIVIERLREQGYRFDRITPEVQPVHIKSNRLQG